jgi:hypothetical protein
MKTTNHAPEPWTIRRLSRWHDGTPQEFDLLEVVSRQGYRLAITNDCKPKAVATANLISAAPDLLQVARDYVLLCQLHGMEGAVLDSALAAIAKAEGAK